MNSNFYSPMPIRAYRYVAAKEALTKEIYEKKCARPTVEDILNCIYDMQHTRHRNDASRLHRVWKKDNAVFGAVVRERFKESFWEVAEIEALEEIERYAEAVRHRRRRHMK